MVATSGARLLDADALEALRRLLPLATVITPNLPEAELLLGRKIADHDAAEAALPGLLALGAGAVLLKGGHLPGDPVLDRLAEGDTIYRFEHPRLALSAHGGGCTLAAAVAANLAVGQSLAVACEGAAHFLHGALRGVRAVSCGGHFA